MNWKKSRKRLFNWNSEDYIYYIDCAQLENKILEMWWLDAFSVMRIIMHRCILVFQLNDKRASTHTHTHTHICYAFAFFEAYAICCYSNSHRRHHHHYHPFLIDIHIFRSICGNGTQKKCASISRLPFFPSYPLFYSIDYVAYRTIHKSKLPLKPFTVQSVPRTFNLILWTLAVAFQLFTVIFIIQIRAQLPQPSQHTQRASKFNHASFCTSRVKQIWGLITV